MNQFDLVINRTLFHGNGVPIIRPKTLATTA